MKKSVLFLPALMFFLLVGGLAPAQGDEAQFKIVRLDPALDDLILPDTRIETLAGDFTWTEGPVWRKSAGYLLFSDIPKNTIYRWKEGEGISVFLRPSGYDLGDTPDWELGSNALIFDAQNRLVMCNHGNRRIDWVNEAVFTKTTLAEKYHGKRFNSPNDLVFKSNGDLYFTDPPYGLDKRNQDPKKELDFNGVFRLSPQGELTLLTRDLTFPNGLGFSPDEKTFYVAVSDPQHPAWMAYDVQPDGTIANGRIFFDATEAMKQGKTGLPDGMKVDRRGNIFAAGPGGLYIFSPAGKQLGLIQSLTPAVRVSNCAWGDDGSTLYFTATSYLMRIKLATKGNGF
jgi:gluconolactonase